MSDLRISISPNIFTTDIYIYQRVGDKILLAKPVEFVYEEIDEGKLCDPTLRLSYSFAHEFLTAFAEALDGEGIKTNKDAKIEGILEATRYHLEDCRALLNLKKSK